MDLNEYAKEYDIPLDTNEMMARANQLLLSLADDMKNIPKRVLGEFLGISSTYTIAQASANPLFARFVALCQDDLFSIFLIVASSAYALAMRDSITLEDFYKDSPGKG